jgi:hypothetical protein
MNNNSFSLFLLGEKCLGLPPYPNSLPWEEKDLPYGYISLTRDWISTSLLYPKLFEGAGEKAMFNVIIKTREILQSDLAGEMDPGEKRSCMLLLNKELKRLSPLQRVRIRIKEIKQTVKK